MDGYNTENHSEDLLTLLAGFDELIRNAYITGFKDGQEFQLKIDREEANIPGENRQSDSISKSDLNKMKVLSEAEQILGEYP